MSASGYEASRFRAFVRAAIAWTPAVLLGSALDLNALPDPSAAVSPLDWFPLPTLVVFVLASAILVVGIVWMARDPARGLQDRLAGTYLVPK